MALCRFVTTWTDASWWPLGSHYSAARVQFHLLVAMVTGFIWEHDSPLFKGQRSTWMVIAMFTIKLKINGPKILLLFDNTVYVGRSVILLT